MLLRKAVLKSKSTDSECGYDIKSALRNTKPFWEMLHLKLNQIPNEEHQPWIGWPSTPVCLGQFLISPSGPGVNTHSVLFALRSLVVWVIKYVATLTMDKQGLVVTLNTSRKELSLQMSMYGLSKNLSIYHLCFTTLPLKFNSITKSP